MQRKPQASTTKSKQEKTPQKPKQNPPHKLVNSTTGILPSHKN